MPATRAEPVRLRRRRYRLGRIPPWDPHPATQRGIVYAVIRDAGRPLWIEEVIRASLARGFLAITHPRRYGTIHLVIGKCLRRLRAAGLVRVSKPRPRTGAERMRAYRRRRLG